MAELARQKRVAKEKEIEEVKNHMPQQPAVSDRKAELMALRERLR